MHYRTARIDFLEGIDGFLEQMPHVREVPATSFETAELEARARRTWSCPPRPEGRP